MTADALRWPRLERGDLVRLVSPASFPSDDGIAATRAVLESWGLEVQLGEHARDQWGYLAGRDADRLEDLNSAFRDPEVRAIVTTRGGAGAYRICDEIDFDTVRADPKPLIGFSDITYLQMALWRAVRLPSVHGFLVGARSVATAKRLTVLGESVEVSRDDDAYSAGVRHAGVASGTLLGGNLSSLCHMIGAGLPSLHGAVLLLEDKRDMGLGRIDRQLTQLTRAGALDGIAGVALGLFTGFDGFEDRGWSLLDLLEQHLQPLGVPILGGLKIGHNGLDDSGLMDQACVALGSHCVLDADAGTLVSEAPTL